MASDPTAPAHWKSGFRHRVEHTATGWRCADCGREFGDRWPSDDEACPGPATASSVDLIEIRLRREPANPQAITPYEQGYSDALDLVIDLLWEQVPDHIE